MKIKTPFGFKFFTVKEIDGKRFAVFRLKWYYAVYLAIVSVFSAEWYQEICLPDGAENNDGGKEKL